MIIIRIAIPAHVELDNKEYLIKYPLIILAYVGSTKLTTKKKKSDTFETLLDKDLILDRIVPKTTIKLAILVA